MNILLISGGMHQTIVQLSPKKIGIVNSDQLMLDDALEYIQKSHAKVDGVLITEEAFLQRDREDIESLRELFAFIKKNDSAIQIKFIVRTTSLNDDLEDLSSTYGYLDIMTTELVRIPLALYKQGFESFRIEKKNKVNVEVKSSAPEKKTSFFDRFKKKPKTKTEHEGTDQLAKEIEKLSRGISRVVAITGHRGAGLTSTVVNIASEAKKRGLNVIVLDMDIEYRSMNMYFSSFHEYTKRDEDINASLIRMLAKPHDYSTTGFNLKDNLWLASLGYDFADQKLIHQFYTTTKLVGLLSMLRNNFNLILLDIPLDLLKVFKESLIHFDVFGLCIPNNLYSVLSTLRNVDVALDREQVDYLYAKSKVVVTKYNDQSRFQNEIFTPERVSEILGSGLHDSLLYELKVAGHVPYSHSFDIQIETDVPLVNSSREYEKAYGNILLRLMEGIN